MLRQYLELGNDQFVNTTLQFKIQKKKSITIKGVLLLVYGEFLLHPSVEETNTQFTTTYRTAYVHPQTPR